MDTNQKPTAKPPERFASGTSSSHRDGRTLIERLRDLEAQIADYMEPERKAEIGARLKRARENSPHQQHEVAEKLNLQVRTYQFWEQGTKGINRRNIERAAKIIGADPDWIWEGAGEAAPQLDRIEQAVRDTTARLDAIEAVLRELATEELLAALERETARQAKKPAGTRAPKRRAQGQ